MSTTYWLALIVALAVWLSPLLFFGALFVRALRAERREEREAEQAATVTPLWPQGNPRAIGRHDWPL